MYKRFYQIVNGEEEQKNMEVSNQGGTIDIDWSQIDENITLEGSNESQSQWTMVDDPSEKAQTFEVKEDLSKYD